MNPAPDQCFRNRLPGDYRLSSRRYPVARPGPLAQASTNHITIRGNSADLKLSGPSANVPGVDVSVNVIQTNRQYYLSVVFPKGFEIQPGQSVSLAVKNGQPAFSGS